MLVHTSKNKTDGSPLYETLAEQLRQSIRTGVYRAGDLLGSEHGLAREASISRMTVRRASEILISEGLLERRPGKGLYVRNPEAAPRALRTVQVISGNLSWEPSLQISRGVQATARSERIQVQLYDAHGDVEADLEMLRQLPEGEARGAVIMSLHSPAFSETVCWLKTTGFPFVLVDQRMHDIDVPSVTADNYAGGYEAGKLLASLGHRRVAFVGDLVAATVQDRLAGLRDAVADAGLPLQRSQVIDLAEGQNRLADWSGGVAEAVRDLMRGPTPPTAIFFSCDAVARWAYRPLAEMGLRVPEDVSLVGFDNDPLAEWLNPGLTTVRQPFESMGRAAMELLCRRMDDPLAPVEHQVLPVELVVRGSAAPPPSTSGARP